MTNPDHLKIAAVFPDESAAAAFRTGCATLNGHHLDATVSPLADVRPNLQRFAASDVLLVDVDPNDGAQLADLQRLLAAFDDKPVIATAAAPTVRDIRGLLHMGVVDVLPQPHGPEDLDAALRLAVRARLAPPPAKSHRHGRKVAFLKAAGGAGATTLAVQTACLLADAPKRRAAPSVCLVDLDIQQGAAGIHLDLPACDQLPGLVASPERMDDALLEGLIAHHTSGVGVVTAPPRILPLDTLDPTFVGALIDTAARAKDYVLLDLPAAWIDWKLAALQTADLVVLVTELTVPGIRHARLQLDTLTEQGLADVPLAIIANRYNGRGGSVAIAAAEKALDRPIHHRIRNDWPTASEAINQGVALRHIKRRSKLEKSLRNFVDAMVRQPERRAGEPSLNLESAPRFDSTALEAR